MLQSDLLSSKCFPSIFIKGINSCQPQLNLLNQCTCISFSQKLKKTCYSDGSYVCSCNVHCHINQQAHMCTHIHIDMSTHKHAYTCKHTHMNTYAKKHAHRNIHICTKPLMHKQAQINKSGSKSQVQTGEHINTYTYVYIGSHKYVNMGTQTCKHHTHVPKSIQS